MSHVYRWLLSVIIAAFLSLAGLGGSDTGAPDEHDQPVIAWSEDVEQVVSGRFGVCVQMSVTDLDVTLRNQTAVANVRTSGEGTVASVCIGGPAGRNSSQE